MAEPMNTPWTVKNYDGSEQHYVVDTDGRLVASVPALRVDVAQAIVAAPARIAELEAAVRELLAVRECAIVAHNRKGAYAGTREEARKHAEAEYLRRRGPAWDAAAKLVTL